MFSNFWEGVKDRGPAILIAFGCAGIAAMGFKIFKDTPKYHKEIEEKKKKLGIPENEEVPFKEKWKTAAKVFWPSAAIGVASGACFLGAHHIDVKRQIGLSATLAITERAYDEYRNKVKEKLGEKSEREIRDEIAVDKMKQNPPPAGIVVREGEQLFYCPLGNQWFSCTHEIIRQAEADICRRLPYEHFVSLNEFYDYLGVPHLKIGDDIGWTAERPIEIARTSSNDAIVSPWGTAALIVPYRVEPRWRDPKHYSELSWS